MKKSILMSLILPLAAVTLAGCVKYNGKNKDGSPKDSTVTTQPTTSPTTDTGESDPSTPSTLPPAPEGNVNLYLVLGPTGLYEGSAGTDYEAKWLKHAVTGQFKIGAALPGKDKVTSTESGATFLHWVNRDTTEVVSVVPEIDSVLVAVFEGGSGGNTPKPSSGVPTEGYGFLFETPEGADPYWKVANYVGTWPDGETDPDKQWKQYKIDDFKLLQGQKFALCDFASTATWTIDLDGWSLGGKSDDDTKWKEYLSKSDTAYTVLKTFNAKDIYIKLKYQQDKLYMGLGA